MVNFYCCFICVCGFWFLSFAGQILRGCWLVLSVPLVVAFFFLLVNILNIKPIVALSHTLWLKPK